MPKANKALMEPKSRKEGSRKMPDSLRQKMAQAVVGTGPSLVPPGVGPNAKVEAPAPSRPAPKSATSPDINDLLGEGEERDMLRQLIDQHVYINSQKKELEAKLEHLAGRIKPMLDSFGIADMLCDGNAVNYFPSNRKTIDATLLLASGVNQEVITACTKVSESKSLVIKPLPQR